jgi:hypothetical protein
MKGIRCAVAFEQGGEVKSFKSLRELEEKGPDDLRPRVAELRAAVADVADEDGIDHFAIAARLAGSSGGYAELHQQLGRTGAYLRITPYMGIVLLGTWGWDNKVCSAYVKGDLYLWDLADRSDPGCVLFGRSGTPYNTLQPYNFNYRASAVQHLG